MSHFAVLVISDSLDDVEGLLAPYHEYECTGVDDEYVVHVDKTEEAKLDYENYKEDYDSPADFLESWYGISTFEKSEDRYALLNDDGSIKEVMEYTNPNAKWDWWVVGGRWGDYLKHKNGSRCDYLQFKDFDLEGIIDDHLSQRVARYNEVHSCFGTFKGFSTWAQVRDSKEFADDLQAARKFYHNQPQLLAAQKKGLKLGIFEDPEEYMCSPEEFVEKENQRAFCTFAVVDEDGWHEKGSMGWFGCYSDENEDWTALFRERLLRIKPEQYITIVDCHI